MFRSFLSGEALGLAALLTVLAPVAHAIGVPVALVSASVATATGDDGVEDEVTVEAAEELAQDSANQDGGTIKPIPSEGGGEEFSDVSLEVFEEKRPEIDDETASKAVSLSAKPN